MLIYTKMYMPSYIAVDLGHDRWLYIYYDITELHLLFNMLFINIIKANYVFNNVNQMYIPISKHYYSFTQAIILVHNLLLTKVVCFFIVSLLGQQTDTDAQTHTHVQPNPATEHTFDFGVDRFSKFNDFWTRLHKKERWKNFAQQKNWRSLIMTAPWFWKMLLWITLS